MSWSLGLALFARNQEVVGFLDFTWHLALALAYKGAVVGKDQWGPRILPRRRQRATSAVNSTSPPTPHPRLAPIQRSTCGVALLRHLQRGSPPHANVTLSSPIGPSNFTYTASAPEYQSCHAITFLSPREHSGRECLDILKQNVVSRHHHFANTG
jgi:hypothetical protein